MRGFHVVFEGFFLFCFVLFICLFFGSGADMSFFRFQGNSSNDVFTIPHLQKIIFNCSPKFIIQILAVFND